MEGGGLEGEDALKSKLKVEVPVKGGGVRILCKRDAFQQPLKYCFFFFFGGRGSVPSTTPPAIMLEGGGSHSISDLPLAKIAPDSKSWVGTSAMPGPQGFHQNYILSSYFII